MRTRRIVGVVLVLAVLGIAFPGAGEAGVAGGPVADAGGFDALSLLSRIFAAVQGFVSGIADRFVAAEGSSISTNGCPAGVC